MFDPVRLERKPLDDEFQRCNLSLVAPGRFLTVAALFAGIGGIETGLARHGVRPELLCECWEPARAVLKERLPHVPLVGDIRGLRALPKVDVVAAGFPCTDLSQAGRTRGIEGKESSLVGEVFRLLRRRRAPVVLLENVRNMLVLDGGRAMRYLVTELETLGYRWAYRLVDSRFTGVPQRRHRVVLVAAREVDPRGVVLADDAGEPDEQCFSDSTYGFYWTEGLRGLGWAKDAVPPLKGGSTIGIPSPPGIWHPMGAPGHRVLVPGIEEAEKMQGFKPGWTEPAHRVSKRKGTRWKLVGNAVSVGVGEWVGDRLASPAEPILEGQPIRPGDPWPTAAWGAKGKAWKAHVSTWPLRLPYRHLSEVVDLDSALPLSVKGAAGFLKRARAGSLRFMPGFLDDIESHVMFHEDDQVVA
ncbi:MAG: DNA cytosine methyltransferase [Actinomycetota bacterium]